MSDFKREERYIVVKRSDISVGDEYGLREYMKEAGIPTRECVVVEPDWAIYEETWENVQRMAEGEPSIRDELSAKLFDQHKAKVKAKAERDAIALLLGCESDHVAMIDAITGLLYDRDSLRSTIEYLRGELEILRDFGLGFALCHSDFEATRNAIKKEQAKIDDMIALLNGKGNSNEK